jgi:dsDNA-specific endonuclease/ATPase MutS2
MLEKIQASDIPASQVLSRLEADLRAVNEALWEIEDSIRDHERAQDFSPDFVKLARDVYHQNDRRAALKREINVLLGSDIVEEKSYASY